MRGEDPRRFRPTDPEDQNRAEKQTGSHPLVQTPARIRKAGWEGQERDSRGCL